MTHIQKIITLSAGGALVAVLLFGFAVRFTNPTVAARQDAYLHAVVSAMTSNPSHLTAQVGGINFNWNFNLPPIVTTVAVTTPAMIATSSVEGMTARDFLIQDVCLDAQGNVLAKSPLDSSCASIRNLNPNEKLPYNKYDFNGTNHSDPDAAHGYQRNDGFVLNGSKYLIHTFDFGIGGGKFGQFDATMDGYDAYETEGTYASAVGTQDGGGGIQYFQSTLCRAGTTNGLEDSWISFPNAVTRGMSGNTVANLAATKSPTDCPSGYSHSYTTWEFPTTNFTYTGGISLPTVISSHYDFSTIAQSQAMERFYFTRELGNTRWEAWKRASYNANGKTALQLAQDLTAQQRCTTGQATMVDSAGVWYRVDCRDWTNLLISTQSAANWYDPTTWTLPSVFRGTAIATPITPTTPTVPVVPTPPTVPVVPTVPAVPVPPLVPVVPVAPVTVAAPISPTGLKYACNTAGTQVTLSWTATPSATKYHVRLDYPPNNAKSCQDGWYCASNPDFSTNDYVGTSISYAVTPDASYSWWVHAANTTGYSAPSNAGFKCASPVPVVIPTPTVIVPSPVRTPTRPNTSGTPDR